MKHSDNTNLRQNVSGAASLQLGTDLLKLYALAIKSEVIDFSANSKKGELVHEA